MVKVVSKELGGGETEAKLRCKNACRNQGIKCNHMGIELTPPPKKKSNSHSSVQFIQIDGKQCVALENSFVKGQALLIGTSVLTSVKGICSLEEKRSSVFERGSGLPKAVY